LRRRLITVSLAVSTMVALAFLIPLALLVRHVARDRAMTAAERDASAVASLLGISTDPDDVRTLLARTGSGAEGRIVVFLPDGTAVGADHPADDDVDRARDEGVAFTQDDDGRVDLYQPVVLPDGTAVIEVSVPDAELTRGVARSWTALAGVAVVLVAGSLVVADRLAASVVRPTRRLAAAAAALGAGDMDARVDPGGPDEIAEVGSAFNHLATRVRELLAAERELVADLSHRLRTPLTALRLDTEALGPGEGGDRVRADAERLERVVTEVIEEARRPIRTELGARCDAGVIVRERAAFWAALAEEQQRPWEVTVDAADANVRLPPAELAAALDALLANVFAHTPEGSGVEVSLRDEGSDLVLAVDDRGPGFTSDAALRRGVSGAGSTGLGLDIARRTAEAAGGLLSVHPVEPTGARVELRFPRRSSP
jgi:signal transduction histidine kinase